MFKERSINILNSTLFYLEQGEGCPVLFLHGMPVSSQIWRNIIPKLSNHSRCIAPDLIGMGQSGKPNIEYTVFDHIQYIEAFIEALDLNQITLVMHGWGSVIGLEYARRYPDRIKGVACYESHIRPMRDLNVLSLPVQQLIHDLDGMRDLEKLIVQENFLVERFLPMSILKDMDSDLIQNYIRPFKTLASRKPLLTYAKELPIGENMTPVKALVQQSAEYLVESDMPKALLYTVPGFITTMSTIAWAKINFSNLSVYDLGEGLHFAQETQPDLFASALNEWLLSIYSSEEV